jgi:subtilase family serine protease
VFGTEFHEFVHEDWKGSVMNRALEYSLSEEINEYVESVFEVADFPAPVFHPSVISPMVSTEAAGSNPYPNFVSPSFLANHYRITPSVAKKNFGSQGILSCIGQMLSPADLAYFQKFFKLPKQTLTGSTGGHVTNKACQNSLDDCAEANLDVQYITAVGQNISTYNFYYDNCDWLQLVKDLLKLSNPPTVLSMSYSSYEAAFSNSFINTFNNAAMQLGVMGVTLFASSGDDGVSGFATQTTADCDYSPQFPAANPYITSIGATQVYFHFLSNYLFLICFGVGSGVKQTRDHLSSGSGRTNHDWWRILFV